MDHPSISPAEPTLPSPSPAQRARDWALSRIGCPYLMGGTGKACTVAYRRARALQYPASARRIAGACRRMRRGKASCRGCPWWDEAAGKGKPAYDCAQLTRRCMEQAGVSLVSGANSQWRKTAWASSGPLSQMPRDRLCLLYRQDADGRKHHAGVFLGDGTVVHAKGHAYGVVREKLSDVRFTHFGIPRGLYPEDEDALSPSAPAREARV